VTVEVPTLRGAELRQRAVKSTAWFGVTRIVAQVSVWLVTIVLARLLTPADYGLFAMALSVLAFVEIFQEFGLGAAIIQRQQVTREQLNAVFWIVVGASTALAGVVFLGAGVAGTFYGEPQLPALLRVLSIAFVLNSLGMVPQTLLTKEIYLHRRSVAEVAGVMLSIPVALALAFLGYGVWALVVAHVARAVTLNLALAILARWVPGLGVTLVDMREILRFGLRVVGGHVVTTLSNSVNIGILGRMLGGHAVGLYSMGRGLADGPHRISTSVISQVSFPIFSKVQGDRASLTRYFLSISKYLAIISLPIQVGMALIAAELVPIVLSPSWNEMVGLLQLFALGGVAVVLSLPVSPLLNACGRPEVVLKFVSVSSVATAVALLAGATFGLTGVAVAWLVSLVPARWVLLRLGLRELDLSVRDFSRHLVSPFLATGAMAVAMLLVRRVVAGEMPPLTQMMMEIAAGGLTYAALLLLLDRRLSADIRTMARDLFVAARA
jgi:teichuronic acid exporter